MRKYVLEIRNKVCSNKRDKSKGKLIFEIIHPFEGWADMHRWTDCEIASESKRKYTISEILSSQLLHMYIVRPKY